METTAQSADFVPRPTPRPRRPAERTAIYLLALVLGATEIAGGLGATTNFIGGSVGLPSVAVAGASEIEQVAAIYQEMKQKIAVATANGRVRRGVFVLAQLVVSAGLLAGAIYGLAGKPAGKVLLLTAFCGGVFLELAGLMPNIRDVQRANLVMQQDAPRMLRAISGPAPAYGDDGLVPPTAALVAAVGRTEILMTLAAMLFKTGFYCVGLRSLTHDCKP